MSPSTMLPHICSMRSRSRQALWPARATNVIKQPSFWFSSTGSTRQCPPSWRFIWSWTTTRPARQRRKRESARHPHWHGRFNQTLTFWINQIDLSLTELKHKQWQGTVSSLHSDVAPDTFAIIGANTQTPKPHYPTNLFDEIFVSVKSFGQKNERNFRYR